MFDHKPKVITIVGAESSGKTTLAMQLRESFDCLWVPEYARGYLVALGRPYTEADLEIIAERQLEAVQEVIHRQPSTVNREQSKIVNRQSSIVIVDGGMMNLRMWMKIKYKRTIPIIEKALKNDVTDLYLLCRPHDYWEADPLREAPSLIDRVWIYNQYLDELTRGEKPMEILSGSENERLAFGITLIEYLLSEKKL